MIVVSDWDETLTTKDTISLLSKLPYMLGGNDFPPWKHFVNIYLSALNDYTKSQRGGQLSRDLQIAYQKGLLAVEHTSIDAIEKHRLFKGLTSNQLRGVAKDITLRPGAAEFLKSCSGPIAILSINWSLLPIRETLTQQGISMDHFFVNELEVENGLTTGLWDRTKEFRTGFDKLLCIQELKKKYEKVVYIGDSSTDLLALKEADIGIIIEGSSLLKEEIPGLFVRDWWGIPRLIHNK